MFLAALLHAHTTSKRQGRAIEASLPVESGASTYGVWSATSVSPDAPAAPVEPPKPLLEFSFTETAQTAEASRIRVPEKDAGEPAKLDVADMPEVPVAPDAPPPPADSIDIDIDIGDPGSAASLSLAGQQLLAGLLEIDAVVAVGAQCGLNGAAAVLIGHAPGLNAADSESAERAFRTHLNDETGDHLALAKLHPASGKQNQKILTRWRNHFTLSFDVRGSELAVVLLQMAEGYNNESLVRAAVRACLNDLDEPIFERL